MNLPGKYPPHLTRPPSLLVLLRVWCSMVLNYRCFFSDRLQSINAANRGGPFLVKVLIYNRMGLGNAQEEKWWHSGTIPRAKVWRVRRRWYKKVDQPGTIVVKVSLRDYSFWLKFLEGILSVANRQRNSKQITEIRFLRMRVIKVVVSSIAM